MSDLRKQVDKLMQDPLLKDMPRFYVEKFLLEDPNWPDEFRENARRHRAELEKIDRRRQAALAPLFAELDAAGLLERSDAIPNGFLFDDLKSNTYAIVLKWYPRIMDEQARAYMSSRLDRPEAANWIPELIALYRSLDTTVSDGGNNFKIASAIGTYAGDEHLESVIEISADPGVGKSRSSIIREIWKFNYDSRVVPLLVRIVNEHESEPVEREALYSLRRIGDRSTRSIFQQYLDHNDAAFRKIARDGIAKVDKVIARKGAKPLTRKTVKKRVPKPLRPWPHDLPHDALVSLMLAELLKLESLAGMSERSLLDIRGVGPATIERIQRELADRNLPPLTD